MALDRGPGPGPALIVVQAAIGRVGFPALVDIFAIVGGVPAPSLVKTIAPASPAADVGLVQVVGTRLW